jgi:hypothetical protein
VDLDDVPFCAGYGSGSLGRGGFLQMDGRVGKDLGNIGTRGDSLDVGQRAAYEDHVGNPECLMFQSAALQQFQKGSLAPGGSVGEAPKDVSAFFVFGYELARSPQVGPFGEGDEKFSPAAGGALDDGRVNFAFPNSSRRPLRQESHSYCEETNDQKLAASHARNYSHLKPTSRFWA